VCSSAENEIGRCASHTSKDGANLIGNICGRKKRHWLGPAIPGEILLEEYLKPLGLGQLEAAKRLGISLNRLNEIVLGKRGITADTALRLARLLKTSPQLWMRLQADWDLHEAVQRQARRAS
jgi:addiction module HigA family antidote